MTGDEDQGANRRGNLLTLPVRLLLHSTIKLFVLLYLEVRTLLRPKAVRYGLVALVVVVAVGLKMTGGTIFGMQAPGLQAAGSQGGTMSVAASSQLPPSPTIEKYLQAQAAFDAKGMWDLIGDDMKSSMQASGDVSVQALQQELDNAKKQGRRYNSALYVGGVPISNGQNVYFYVLKVDSPSGSTDVPYIYVVGSDGKIASIQ